MEQHGVYLGSEPENGKVGRQASGGDTAAELVPCRPLASYSQTPEPSPVLGAGVLLVKRRILKTEADVLDDRVTKMGK